jgi:hypothetical protein
MLELTKTRTLGATLVVAAIAAPSAAAMPIDSGHAAGHTPPPVTRTVEVRAHGFDWGDAAIGAAATLSVLGRRRRRRARRQALPQAARCAGLSRHAALAPAG